MRGKTVLAGSAVLLALVLAFFASAQAFDFSGLLKRKEKKHAVNQPVATAAIRGLDEGDEAGDMDARDEAAAAWLESQKVSEAELAAFLKEGGLEAKP